MPPVPTDVVKTYIDHINAGDADGLEALAIPKLRFVDALGVEHALGSAGWKAYFSDFPDYRVHVQTIIAEGEMVAVFGFASGSYKGRGKIDHRSSWRIPSAWKAKVRGGKIVEWWVYADLEPMLRSAGQSRFK